MDYLIKISSGSVQGPFNIYKDSVSVPTLLASNISKKDMTLGYTV
jgi:hypothetical protein